MPSWKTPTPEAVARARGQLVQPQHYRYFFERLENPRWLRPLHAQGFFAHPPAPVTDAEGGVTFPAWPASRYLAQMAAVDDESAQRVLEIALQIPDTDNNRVHEDLLDAALAMSPAQAARFVPKAKGWVRRPYQLLLPEKIGALVSLLARGGQVNGGLDLAKTLLAVRVEERAPVELEGGELFSFPPEARAYIDIWRYQQIIEKHIPDLVAAGGERTLKMLCGILNAAVHLSRHSPEDRGPEDHSRIWRRRTAGRDDLAGHDVLDVLVTAVRDAAEQLAAADPTRVPLLVALIEGYRWRIFQRLALHLLRRFPDHAADLIAERLTDRARFEDLDLWQEYTLLAGEHFPNLTPGQQDIILSWIEAGPDPEDVAARWAWRAQQPAAPPEAEYVEADRKHWQLRRLARLREVLPPPWRARHDALAGELGEIEQAEFPTYQSGVRSGPNSPKGVDELRAMDLDALLAYLRTWQSEGQFPFGPSVEGLGREISRMVAENPAPFAAAADHFRDLDLNYLWGLLTGLYEAVRAGRPIDWAAVVDLCRWVVTRPTLPAAPGDEEKEPGPRRGWVRGTVADLIEAGLAATGAGAIPFALRERLWATLVPLTDDPEPPYEGENPADQSINSVRGKAMHAVVRYALWVRRNLGPADDRREATAQGFDALPEVRTVLDRHLDPRHDPSPVIHSVYGQWLPWLVQLDREWVRHNLAAIFPRDPSLHRLRAAAWETYLQFCEAYDDTYGALREEYARAAGELDAGSSGERVPERRLAEHLMALYGRGRLDPDDPTDPLARFYAAAPAALRGRALAYVGRVLRQAPTVPAAILGRYRALWERRLAASREVDTAASALELPPFGWWFASGKFPDEWGIAQLRATLDLVPQTEPDHLVIARLAGLAAAMPLPAVECLRLIIEGDTRNWGITGRHEQIRSILTAALHSGNAAARIATTLVHVLGSRGYLHYRDLLPTAPA